MSNYTSFDREWERTIYIATDSKADGDGSKNRPLLAPGGNMRDILRNFVNSPAEFVLKPGQYFTPGNRVSTFFRMRGESGRREDVIITLRGDLKKEGITWPFAQMFTEATWCHWFMLEDLTVDGNWHGLGDQVKTPDFKLQPIVVRCTKGQVRNVAVLNCGSNGTGRENEGWEAFPLWLQTFSGGPPWRYISNQQLADNEADWSYVEIKDCLVKGMYGTPGGYWTCINMTTNAPWDRMPIGVRESVAGRVINCVVEDFQGGIAFGTAHSEKVEFIDNKAINGTHGFNYDTIHLHGLRLMNNSFSRVSKGVKLVSFHPKTSDIVIQNNVIELDKDWFNPVSKQSERMFGIQRIGNPIPGLVTNNNVVRGPNGEFDPFLGITPSATDRVEISQGDSEHVAALQSRVTDLEAQVARLTKDLAGAKVNSIELQNYIRDRALEGQNLRAELESMRRYKHAIDTLKSVL